MDCVIGQLEVVHQQEGGARIQEPIQTTSETIVVGRTRVAATEHELRVHAELFVALFYADAVTLFGPIVSIHPEMWGLLLVKEQERSAWRTLNNRNGRSKPEVLVVV